MLSRMAARLWKLGQFVLSRAPEAINNQGLARYPVKIFHNDAQSLKCISLDERAHTRMRRSERRANVRGAVVTGDGGAAALPLRCRTARPRVTDLTLVVNHGLCSTRLAHRNGPVNRKAKHRLLEEYDVPAQRLSRTVESPTTPWRRFTPPGTSATGLTQHLVRR